jgi:hypothetical protein
LFLDVMLEEINSKFDLQLDLTPITDWSSLSATDTQSESSPCIVLVRSSHSSRLIDLLESAHLTSRGLHCSLLLNHGKLLI